MVDTLRIFTYIYIHLHIIHLYTRNFMSESTINTWGYQKQMQFKNNEKNKDNDKNRICTHDIWYRCNWTESWSLFISFNLKKYSVLIQTNWKRLLHYNLKFIKSVWYDNRWMHNNLHTLYSINYLICEKRNILWKS